MSEETKKFSAFQAFAQAQQTFAEAEEKAKQEAGAPRLPKFRIGEAGEYPIRILPLAPAFDAEGNVLPMDRKGYEYAVHQFFLGIKVPAKKGGKSKKVSIPVIRTTDKEVGYSVDLIDTYVKIAKEMYADDEELIKLITGNSYSGGLRWNYQHAIMVLDVSSEKERAKGPQLWQCSHKTYKMIDAAKLRLWKELREDGGQETCPISWFTDAYPVKVIRTDDGQTQYTIEIGRKPMDVKEEEANLLLELPRISDEIYRYTKYQLEATLAFLQQYDEEHEMEVCKASDFKDAVEKLKGELPADDTSHFDLNGAAAKSADDKGEVTIDSLWAEYDVIVDQDLSEKSDEYQDLRERIRQFIEDKNLDVRISRTKNNQQLLEEIEDAMGDQANQAAPATPVSSPAPAVSQQDEPDEAEEAPAVAEEETPRRRRPRPGSEEDEKPAVDETVGNDVAPAAADEEAPRRRLHSRRMR